MGLPLHARSPGWKAFKSLILLYEIAVAHDQRSPTPRAWLAIARTTKSHGPSPSKPISDQQQPQITENPA